MRVIIAAGLLAAGAFSASGGVVWDSLASADAASAPFDVTLWRAAGFRVTGSSQVNISSVSMDLAGTISGTVNVRVFADNASKPGTPLGRISDIPVNAGDNAVFEAPSDTVFTLDPGSVYWVIVRMRPSTGSGAWGTQTSFTETTFQGSGLTFTGGLTSANSGSTWTTWSDIPGLKLDIVQVPEPSTVALIGGAAIMTFGLARKRS